MRARGRIGSLFSKEPRFCASLLALLMFMAIAVPLYLYTSYREERLERHGVTTSGTVVSEEPACSGGTCQSVRVSYAVNGERYELDANTDPNGPRSDVRLRVGQSVELRYDPERPGRARLLTPGESEAVFFRFMIFFGLFVLGVPAVWFGAKALLRRVKPPSEAGSDR